MKTRKLGGLEVWALGLGCTSMSELYGVPDEAEALVRDPNDPDARSSIQR